MSNSKVTSDKPAHSLQPAADPGRHPVARFLMQVLWPAFVGAALTVGLLFSLIDPMEIDWVAAHLHDSREASYTIGFLLLWGLFSLACGTTWYLASTETPRRAGRRRMRD